MIIVIVIVMMILIMIIMIKIIMMILIVVVITVVLVAQGHGPARTHYISSITPSTCHCINMIIINSYIYIYIYAYVCIYIYIYTYTNLGVVIIMHTSSRTFLATFSCGMRGWSYAGLPAPGTHCYVIFLVLLVFVLYILIFHSPCFVFFFIF